MWSETEAKAARVINRPLFTLGVIFVALILVMLCVLSGLSLNLQKLPRGTPTQEILMVDISTEMSTNDYSIRLPVILSGNVSVSDYISEQIWIVTKIKSLGYEMDGRRYDLAIFNRVDSEETVKAYCINLGWDTPNIGAEYLLTAGDIFVPLYDRDVEPFQRFLKIQ
jgi:hypothetical protein